MPNDWLPFITALGLLILHSIGFLHAVHALMTVRSSQGATAWILSLITAPWIAIPIYWIAGRDRFNGYVRARRADDARLREVSDEMHRSLRHFRIEPDDAFGKAAEFLGGLPFTRGNQMELLINGKATFDSIFDSIRKAQKYILVNFYIVKNDRVGEAFKNALINRAKDGVKVYFLFDEFGSSKLPRRYLQQLRQAGVECHAFGSNRFWWSRFQVNFRNHRKIVIVDGQDAFVGGLNVGDEYLGRNEEFGAWRDTHLRLRGPSVQAVQLVFLEDWHWACNSVPDLHWSAQAETADQQVAIIPTGPADPADSWQLVVAEAAATARERLWIASPYFVPNGGVLTALQIAALRGVDVRILIPERADHLLVWLAAYTYLPQTIPFGVKIHRYQNGFLHQKVMLVDDALACVGTANLDQRSFRLNFEISALSSDPTFVREVHHMLHQDFHQSRPVRVSDFSERPFPFRLACRAARLMAPVL